MPRSRVVVALAAVALLAVVVPTSAVPVGADAPIGFSDVSGSHPFYDEIMWMAAEGYSTGYPDGTYRPADEVTRQAVVQMLWRMSGKPLVGPAEPFTDVTASHPFYAAINWAYATGVVGGYSDGTFRSTVPLTRQALGSILHDLSGVDGYGTSTFVDVPVGHPFLADISWWVLSGQAVGYSDGTFRPAAAVTRQSLAAFLQRFDEMMGGYWPYIDHHTHVCDTPPTAEDQAVAAHVLADATEAVETLYPTKAAAEAAGYRVNAPPFGGAGAHMVNDEFSRDGIQLDPTKPESLVLAPGVQDGSTEVAAEMFVREYVGPGPLWPPEPAGCLTLWHAHDNLCYDKPFLEGGVVTWLADFGGCTGGKLVRITPEMLHVWVDGRVDVFEGIDT